MFFSNSKEWIPSVSVSACDLDQTVSSSILVHQRKANEEEEDDDNLRRAVFLLSTDDDATVCKRCVTLGHGNSGKLDLGVSLVPVL